ncbi:hypothetical protein DQ04_00251230 [Trypanosoma grayi]|uniref:hypothetical protein n=1 Tax=Trypanosoma grayi TaxID=71804 RepID=UPI0004F45738|nr:hypothetical protein DQ04_00251230 [Trypanosoma grayi]KEG14947.1 hypothetical protein DQ04_00251230 [Trypanosoma grayi]
MSAEDSSTVSTSSLLEEQHISSDDGRSINGSENTNVNRETTENDKAQRRLFREEQRLHRIKGRLTEVSLSDMCTLRCGRYEYFVENTIVCIRGSYSQFDAREGRTKSLMPPQTHDCCQTFSTVAAIILSSLGFAVTMQECSNMSTVNYFLYISAWLHQLSAPAWPQKKARPTIGDLNACLRLREFFPSQINEGEFEVLFYNQQERAKELIDHLCGPIKRGRDSDDVRPVCGYVIASGDYTVSIFSLAHDVRNQPSTRYREAWSLYICDSHGTQPWSDGKACLTGITLAVPRAGCRAGSGVVEKEEGLRYFTLILFALLEDHRKKSTSTKHIPYMTWSPIRRKRVTVNTAQEIKTIIDENWIPSLMKNEVIAREARRYKFTPMQCFMGVPAAKAETANTADAPRPAVVLRDQTTGPPCG